MNRSEDLFAKRLRDAGAAVTPAASEPLHTRVLASVRRELAAASASAPVSEQTPAWQRWWGIGATAAAKSHDGAQGDPSLEQ